MLSPLSLFLARKPPRPRKDPINKTSIPLCDLCGLCAMLSPLSLFLARKPPRPRKDPINKTSIPPL
jgi:hypothetical protein